MTITEHPTPNHPAPAPAAPAAPVGPAASVEPDADRVQHLDPRGLLLDRNVRTRHLSAAEAREEARAHRELTSSVRQRGVQQPITAVATDDGRARVLYGERRTRAAIAAERATVPVIVRPAQAADDPEASAAVEAERIASQIDENTNRRGLSSAEQLSAFAQLADLGRTPGQIAKATSMRRRDVVDGLAAAGNDAVRDAVTAAELTLAEGAGLAEFADDPQAYQALLASATDRGRGHREDFPHLLARLRDDRDEAAQKRALLAELAAAGVPVVEAPFYNDPVKALDDLTDDPPPDPDTRDVDTGDDGARPGATGPGEAAPITPQEHAGCPGHVAFLRRDHAARDRRPRLLAVYGCADPVTHGHRARRGHVRLRPAGAPAKRVGETPEQAAEREAAQKETDRVARRRVRAGNSAWRAAETVRHEHLRTLLARKTPPAGAGVYLATAIILDSFVLSRAGEKSHQLSAALLTGREDSDNRGRIALACEQASDARAQVIALALICAGLEASIDVHCWRHRDDRAGGDWQGINPALGRYLRFLAATGYPLSPIERFAIGDPVDEHDIFSPPGDDAGDDGVLDGLDVADAIADANPGEDTDSPGLEGL